MRSLPFGVKLRRKLGQLVHGVVVIAERTLRLRRILVHWIDLMEGLLGGQSGPKNPRKQLLGRIFRKLGVKLGHRSQMLTGFRRRWWSNVEALHQAPLLLAVLLATDSAAGTGGARCVHAAVLQNLDQFTAKRRNVLLDLVDVVLGDALGFGLALLHGHVPPHQVPHDALVPEVPLAGLLYLPLKESGQEEEQETEQTGGRKTETETDSTFKRGREQKTGSSERDRVRETVAPERDKSTEK